MRTRQSLKLIVIILTLLAAAAAMIMPAYAQDNTNVSLLPSILTIDPIQTQPIGVPITITAHLKNQDGEGNPNKVFVVYLNDEVVRRIRTDDQGTASIRIGSDLLAGNYTIRVEFSGTQAYLPSTASTTLVVRPARLTIKTVPPLANIPFSLDGKKFESDAQGVAHVEISKLGEFPLEVLLETDTQISDDTRVTFDRWRDEYQPKRTINIQGDDEMEAGFSVSHPVSQIFSDLENNPVDMARINSITLQGTDGSKFTFNDGTVRWLRGGRIARRQNGLEATQIMYSVESVLINGSNTVNRYQQRFFVKPNDVWPIQLLLYHATFRAADAVFGFPVGKGINVKYPDGHIEFLPFGKDNEVKIGPVPRGEYKVQVMGASGMSPETPLALSRNQELDLKVVSTLNLGLGASLGAFGVLGLLLFGRPYLPRVAFQITRDIVTFRFLKNNNVKQPRLPAKVQYALPETSVIQTSQAPSPVIEFIMVESEVVEASPVTAPVAPVEEPEVALMEEETISSEPVVAGVAEKVEATSLTHPGYLGLQDSYRVGSVDGISDVYQQTYIDVYSGLALVKLYDKKDGRVAADMLNSTVLPWFKDHQVTIEKVMTDRGREYIGTGKQKTHQYQMALASNGIEHTKNDKKDPQDNGICTEFHQLMHTELYNNILPKGKTQSMSLEALQAAVDNWLKRYNTERPFNGQAQGETPLERLNGKKGSVV
ncbi:MAG: Ig-like domain repeat protein [Chloroflexota bacterium]